jgi:hypothetical protein
MVTCVLTVTGVVRMLKSGERVAPAATVTDGVTDTTAGLALVN